jgi:histidinol-phosphate aminotransferase
LSLAYRRAVAGRVVVITGSTRGIGLELAKACIALGDRVVVHGRAPEKLAAELGAIGIAADLATVDGPAALIAEALAACGRIDVLVNNAASSPARTPLWEAEPGELGDAIAINVRAPQLCARALLAWSIPAAHHVRIINVSSGLAGAPREGAATYASTKAALDGFTRALALDVGDRATVVAVQLGAHRTELSRRMLSDDEYRAIPDASAAARTLRHAIESPADHVHGRVLGSSELALDVSQIDLLAHPLGPSPLARAALARAAHGPIDRYPDRDHLELRKLLAAHHGVALDGIALGGGISELLGRILQITTRPGETVIAHVPSWPVVPHALRGLRWRRVAYRVTDHVDHDLDAIERAIDRGVRVVYLTSPSNPGGRALDAGPFERFLARLPSQVTVIVDEAYGDFATREEALRAARFTSWCDQLIVLRSFSKLYGLAGLRIGYAIAAPSAARVFERTAPLFPLVHGVADAAAAAVSDHAHTRRVIAELVAQRTKLERRLDERGIARLHSDAPFVLAAVPGVAGPRFFDRYVMLPAWAEID